MLSDLSHLTPHECDSSWCFETKTFQSTFLLEGVLVLKEPGVCGLVVSLPWAISLGALGMAMVLGLR